jgi:hypothetical protein
MSSQSFRVGVLALRLIGAVCFITFLGLSVAAFKAGQHWPIGFFGFLTLFAVYMIVGAGTFELSDDAVSQQSIFGHFRMTWADIRNIERGTQGTLVFHGDNRRFVLSSPALWSGKHKPEAVTLLARKIQTLGLTPYPSNVADYKIHKNVRVR